MAVKIRLARHGKKNYAFYHIIAADSRSPRDGKFIEKIGTYNPNTNPATIDLNPDRALYWLTVGAQPTETCRLILSYKGILYKKHLLEGVKKGALTEEAAQAKFDAWVAEKENKIQAKKDSLKNIKNQSLQERHAAEVLVKEAMATEQAKKKQEALDLLAAEKAEKAAAKAAEEAANQVTEAPVVETPVVETPETEA